VARLDEVIDNPTFNFADKTANQNILATAIIANYNMAA
jgi:hypothetical protein